MRLIRTPLTWYAYLLSGFFTFIISLQGNIMPFLRDELGLNYAAVSLHPSALAAGMMATGLFTERVVAAIGRGWTCLIGVAGCIAGLLVICIARNAASRIAGCSLVGLTAAMLLGRPAGSVLVRRVAPALLYPLSLSFAVGAGNGLHANNGSIANPGRIVALFNQSA